MKGKILTLALLLVMLSLPVGDLYSLDTPYPDGGADNDPNGDDHPWGGDNQSSGGDFVALRNFKLRAAVGIAPIDFFLNLPLLDSYVDSFFSSRITVLDRPEQTVDHSRQAQNHHRTFGDL